MADKPNNRPALPAHLLAKLEKQISTNVTLNADNVGNLLGAAGDIVLLANDAETARANADAAIRAWAQAEYQSKKDALMTPAKRGKKKSAAKVAEGMAENEKWYAGVKYHTVVSAAPLAATNYTSYLAIGFTQGGKFKPAEAIAALSSVTYADSDGLTTDTIIIGDMLAQWLNSGAGDVLPEFSAALAGLAVAGVPDGNYRVLLTVENGAIAAIVRANTSKASAFGNGNDEDEGENDDN